MIDTLLWFEKIILPQENLIQPIEKENCYSKLWENDLLITDEYLLNKGMLKTKDRFKGKSDDQKTGKIPFGGSYIFSLNSKSGITFSPKDFFNFLQEGGINAPSIYKLEDNFENDFIEGEHTCIGVILRNIPKIDLDKTEFEHFLEFIIDSETIKLRRRMFGWENEIKKKNLNPNELQELISTQLDDYKTWIEAAKLKYEYSTFELILTVSIEFLENLIKLKPTQALKSIVNFRKRKADYILDELKAPGRELAFIHQITERFFE